jgi:phenylalanine-4-hydroxylase
MVDTPKRLYFRVRENGAAVFEIDTENRNNRLELRSIASVNIRNGEIKPHGAHELTEEERAAIGTWIENRRKVLEQRDIDDILRTVDNLNLTAAWAQQRATPDELERVTDALLMAMHDLRTVLVRKAADRAVGDDDQAARR